MRFVSQPLQVSTLFPSPKTEEGIKGGVVLLRMRPPTAGNTPLQLTISYTDREGKQFRWGCNQCRTVLLGDIRVAAFYVVCCMSVAAAARQHPTPQA